MDLETANIEDYLPIYDFSEKHTTVMACSPQKAYERLKTLNFSESRLIRILFWLRGLKSGNFQNLQEHFTMLYDEQGKEIVLGMIGRPWTLNGGTLLLSKEEFQSFNKSDYAKMVWNFSFESLNENETFVSTETRILCTSPESRKKFGSYWFFIRPFSGLVRLEILRILKKSAGA